MRSYRDFVSRPPAPFQPTRKAPGDKDFHGRGVADVRAEQNVAAALRRMEQAHG